MLRTPEATIHAFCEQAKTNKDGLGRAVWEQMECPPKDYRDSPIINYLLVNKDKLKHPQFFSNFESGDERIISPDYRSSVQFARLVGTFQGLNGPGFWEKIIRPGNRNGQDILLKQAAEGIHHAGFNNFEIWLVFLAAGTYYGSRFSEIIGWGDGLYSIYDPVLEAVRHYPDMADSARELRERMLEQLGSITSSGLAYQAVRQYTGSWPVAPLVEPITTLAGDYVMDNRRWDIFSHQITTPS